MKLGAASFALAFAVIVPAALEATPMTITFTGTPTLKKGVFGPGDGGNRVRFVYLRFGRRG